MIDSRSPDVLHPEFKARVLEWLEDCKALEIDVLLTCTGRSEATQTKLYAIGRTVPGAGISPSRPLGKTVTNAMAGQSAHQYGLAIDYVPLIGGKPQWMATHPLWDQTIKLAQARGMQSLRPMESAHLQMKNWKEYTNA